MLIVDDHKIFRKSFILLLKSIAETTHFYERSVQRNGSLGELRASKFDLVFLDVSMPIMDGYEACKFHSTGFSSFANNNAHSI